MCDSHLSPAEERPGLTVTYLAHGVIQIRVNLDLQRDPKELGRYTGLIPQRMIYLSSALLYLLGKLAGFYLHKRCSHGFQVAALTSERHSARA